MDLIFRNLDLVLLGGVFSVLFLYSVYRKKVFWTRRAPIEKVVDVIGLVVQGLIVPLFSILVSYRILSYLFVDFKAVLELSPIISFLIPLTFIDYIYYWNHRLLHSKKLWLMHRVHHTPKELDLLVTSRNSFWTPFFLVYIWSQTAFVFILSDPYPFLLGVAVSSGLDLWRHTKTDLPKSLSFLGLLLILPKDHRWHHSESKTGINYGANLNLWDRMHGTLYRPDVEPAKLGFPSSGTTSDWLLTPWRLK